MDDEIPGSEVLAVVRSELLRLAGKNPSELHEIQDAIDDAILESDGDREFEGSLALATLLAYGQELNQADFRATLEEMKRLVPGTSEIDDVRYLDTGISDLPELLLSRDLPEPAPPTLTAEDQDDIEKFFRSVLERRTAAPDTGPAPNRRPRGPRR